MTYDPQRPIDAAFRAFGKAATFAPLGSNPGGPAAAVTVIARRGDQVVDAGGFEIAAKEGGIFELRVTEAAAVAAGDTLTLASGEIRKVQGEPLRLDPDKLVWSLDTVKA